MNKDVEELISRQLSGWNLARDNYAAFDSGVIRTRTVTVDGLEVIIQHNPARISSTNADVSPSAIAARKCFLCRDNRPKEQEFLRWRNYQITVNPYPVFRKHLVICSDEHKPQSITESCRDIYPLVDYLSDALVFYNGPRAGASAPDHLHFQACRKGELPLETGLAGIEKTRFSMDSLSGGTEVFLLLSYVSGIYIIKSDSGEASAATLRLLMDTLPVNLRTPGDEPMVNVLVWKEGPDYITALIPRAKSRPDTFNQFMVAPACVELGGVIITPREKDWESLTAADVEHILRDVCVPFRQPQVKIGLISAPELTVEFSSMFKCRQGTVFGSENFNYKDGKVLWRGQFYDRLDFIPSDEKNSIFSLMVRIGISFHWERHERQLFRGGVSIIPVSDAADAPAEIIGPGAPGMLTVINRIGVEDYLVSVISSEMNSSAPSEFLRAHAIVSRSWLMSKINGLHRSAVSCSELTDDRVTKWYDQRDHSLFDVCADDHCQRYQGIARVRSKKVTDVIKDTWGMVLKYKGDICDARYSKCCGGVTELFENCWNDEHLDYLTAVRDTQYGFTGPQLMNLTKEDNACEWINTSPDSFCRTGDTSILTTVLNNYDQETKDFYRWTVTYPQHELSEIIRVKSGIDFGEIIELVPLSRGSSGRIVELKIIGTLRTMTVGKELEIRRWLSKTHLYSSAFIVEKTVRGDETIFTLHGAGWGHGVGLCQIGAAVMGTKGYTYDQILLHYFRGATIEKLY